MTAVAFHACPKRALLARGLVSGQSTGVRLIFEDNVGTVVKNVDGRCHADKWHLGNLNA